MNKLLTHNFILGLSTYFHNQESKQNHVKAVINNMIGRICSFIPMLDLNGTMFNIHQQNIPSGIDQGKGPVAQRLLELSWLIEKLQDGHLFIEEFNRSFFHTPTGQVVLEDYKDALHKYWIVRFLHGIEHNDFNICFFDSEAYSCTIVVSKPRSYRLNESGSNRRLSNHVKVVNYQKFEGLCFGEGFYYGIDSSDAVRLVNANVNGMMAAVLDESASVNYDEISFRLCKLLEEDPDSEFINSMREGGLYNSQSISPVRFVKTEEGIEVHFLKFESSEMELFYTIRLDQPGFNDLERLLLLVFNKIRPAPVLVPVDD